MFTRFFYKKLKIHNLKNKLFFLSALTGILLWIAWPPFYFGPLLFIAFTPLLLILDYKIKDYSQIGSFIYIYISFLTWNALTTWWIWLASPEGAVMAILANSFLMTIPFFLFQKTRKLLGNILGYSSLIIYWITFEYIHLHWELSWPWLTLGNGLSAFYEFIQWYEYTGVLGGTFWILLVNIVFYRGIQMYLIPRLFLKFENGNKHGSAEISKIMKEYKWRTTLAFSAILFLIPFIISLTIAYFYNEKPMPVETVIVQPNIDPYNDKFDKLTQMQQLSKMINLSFAELNAYTQYLILPETALPEGIWIDQAKNSESIKYLNEYLMFYPNLKIIIGANLYELYENKQTLTATARVLEKDKSWYDAYNSAIQLDSRNNLQIYHKSKLVPGVERIPYPSFFKFLEPLTINLGGISGSLGTQNEREIFVSDNGAKVAPVICYESIFGEYVTNYITKGANVIFILTNDGWWGNTPGYQQHLSYASMLAIETRRSIARSANTGISCYITQTGIIYKETNWWKEEVIRDAINLNDELTFYVKHGDYIGKIALFLSIILPIVILFRKKIPSFLKIPL